MIVQCLRCHLRHDLAGRPPNTQISCRCGAPLEVAPPATATPLTCPQCGGQVDDGRTRCLHCETALATVRCPACFGLAFDGDEHCPHCGASMASPGVVTHDTGREPMPCPRCRTDLDATVVNKTLIDGCDACGGVWLDHRAFETLVRNRRYAQLTVSLNVPPWNRSQRTGRSPRDDRYVQCPVCDHYMHRRRYQKRTKVVLDVCVAHGIWFDTNELGRVLRTGDDDDDRSFREPIRGRPEERDINPGVLLDRGRRRKDKSDRKDRKDDRRKRKRRFDFDFDDLVEAIVDLFD